MSSNSVISIVVIAAASLFAGVIGFVPEDEPQVVSGVAGGTGELVLDEATGADGGSSGGSRLVGGSSGSAGSAGTSTQQGGGQQQQGGGQQAVNNAGLECAPGKNGGKTDKGVSPNKIGLASTIVTSGPGATFLKQSQFGMQAVVAKVNSAGGICGRGLDLKLVNDNWEAQRGHDTLRNFMNDDGIFALPVVPSSEGLAAADQDIKANKIPVVGTDGMRIQQYKNEWIWPVASATVSQARILAQHASDKGASKFAIVYDEFYRFGVEGKDAYVNFVRDKLKKTVVHAEPIQPNQPGYNTQIKNLNDKCGDNGCDVVVMLADPGTANTWIKGDDKWTSRAQFRMGAQPLFTDGFGQDCGLRCDGMLVISGFVPPLESNAGLAGIKEYVQDVKAVQPNADVSNQFLEGAYLGMDVFVEALKAVGPNLTREGLKQTLDGGFSYKSDLAKDLSWTSTKRKANSSGQIWEIKAGSGSFDGFRFVKDFAPDPDPTAE